MNDFMKGRNGADELTIVLGFAGIVIAMIGSMARVQWLSWIAIAVIVIGVLRGLSKNIDARRKENEAFVAATANVPGLGKFVGAVATYHKVIHANCLSFDMLHAFIPHLVHGGQVNLHQGGASVLVPHAPRWCKVT